MTTTTNISTAAELDGNTAGEFVKRIERAIDAVACLEAYGPAERRLDRTMTHEVELACDVLTDCDIKRRNHSAFGNLAQMERIHVAFPDDSRITVLASWNEDQVDILPGRIDGDDWYELRDRRVTFNPWGLAGLSLFDCLGRGDNRPDGEQDGTAVSQT